MKHWKKSWYYVPVDWGCEIETIENLTQKIWIRNNLQGDKIRIRFSNLYDPEPLAIERVVVRTYEEGSEKSSKQTDITYQGNGKIIIPAGSSLISDAMDLELCSSENIMITMYFKEKHTFYAACQTWHTGCWKSRFTETDRTDEESFSGNTTIEALPFFDADVNKCQAALGICELDVLTEKQVISIACMGDSITHMSYYFGPLMEKLYAAFPGQVSLSNCGLGGNRLLYDACYTDNLAGNGRCFGDAGLHRFERDVFRDPKPEIVFFMEGVNDCAMGLINNHPDEVPDGQALEEGLKQVIQKTHGHGSKIVISTVLPFGTEIEPFHDQSDSIRQDFNKRIRELRSLCDGFIDLDKVVQKPDDASFMIDQYHIGDGTHPNAAGGQVIAEAAANVLIPLVKRNIEET